MESFHPRCLLMSACHPACENVKTQPPLRFFFGGGGYHLLTSDPISCAGGVRTDLEETGERWSSQQSSWGIFPVTSLPHQSFSPWVDFAFELCNKLLSLCVHAGILVFSESLLQMATVLYYKPMYLLPVVLQVFLWLKKQGFETKLELLNFLVGADEQRLSFCHWPQWQLITIELSCLHQHKWLYLIWSHLVATGGIAWQNHSGQKIFIC